MTLIMLIRSLEQSLFDRVAELGTKLEWIGNAVKLITDPLPAIRIFDKASQRKVWFNNLSTGKISPMTNDIHDPEAFVELGNGDLVPEQAKKDCLEILEEEYCYTLEERRRYAR